MRWLKILVVFWACSLACVTTAAEPVRTTDFSRPTVYLDRGLGWSVKIHNVLDYSQLRREYARQAFLIAARDELNWRTLDAWLGEQAPAVNSNYLLDIVPIGGDTNTLEILSGPAPRQRRREIIPLPEAATHDDGTEIEAFERMSREAFPQILCNLTNTIAPPRRPWTDFKLPEGVESQLEQMSFYSQFSAVRAIHAEIAAHGESPALLSGLIRGYSHLGLLTEGQWNPSFRVYHARALLYAQRWRAHAPSSASALWHRAYAEAMAGFHARAIGDLEAAAKLVAAEAPAKNLADVKLATLPGSLGEPPDWLPLIRGFVQYDLRPLELGRDQPHAQLAALLHLIAYRQAGTPDLAIRGATKAITWMPECYRMHDELAHMGGSILGHRTTTLTPAVFAMTLYRNVAVLPDCPESVMEIAGPRSAQDALLRGDDVPAEQQDRLKLIKALYAAGKSSAVSAGQSSAGGEPGWGALAFWIEETTFQQVYRRARYIEEGYDTQSSNSLDELLPLVEHHRYRRVLDTFTQDPTAKRAAIERLNHFDVTGLDTRARHIADVYRGLDQGALAYTWNDLSATMDATANDQSLLIGQLAGDAHRETAERLIQVSPRNPQALVEMIELHWDQYQGRIDQFTEMAEQHPRLARAFGHKLLADKQTKRAETFFRLSLKQEHSLEGYRDVANFYRSQGDLDKFQNTLETFLKQEPDLGYDHAEVNDLIASTWVRRGEWAKAAPFAKLAAAGGLDWAPLTTAMICERLNKFDEAEAIYRRVAENAGDHRTLCWFAFCRRTGHGDAKESRRHWDQYRAQHAKDAGNDNVVQFAIADLLDGNAESALALLQHDFDESNNPWMGLCAASAADQLNKPTLRDQLLTAVRERGNRFSDPSTYLPRQNLLDLAGLLADNLKQPGHSALDLAAAERICRQGKVNQVQMACYIVGEFLSRHGKLEDAERFWLHALDDPMPGHLQTEISSARLLAAGIKAEDLESVRAKLGMKERWFSE